MKAIVKGAVISGAGALLLGASLALSSATVVSGASQAHPDATPKPIKCSSKGRSAYCLTVQNTKTGNAIEGEAKSGTGVVGTSQSGIGVSASGYTGVYGAGTGSNSAGVYGTSPDAGVYGISNGGYGVWGTSSSSEGVYGTSGTNSGVYGYSSTSNGGDFENDASGNPALYAQNDASHGYIFEGINSADSGEFEVNNDGDGYFSGNVEATGYLTDVRVRGGPRLEAFSPESTRATIEDTGTARLEQGEGAVRFDSAFAGTIDAARGYQVFLTPNGETRGWLYVAAKYEGGFIVREAEHGRSSIYFDYRVVAHPYGASDARLPQLSLKPPPPHLLRHAQPPQLPQP
jgi:hypothetical protein